MAVLIKYMDSMQIKFPTEQFRKTLPSLNSIIDAGASKTNTNKATSALIGLSFLNHPAQLLYRVEGEPLDGVPISMFSLLVGDTSYGKGRLYHYYSLGQSAFDKKIAKDAESTKRTSNIISRNGTVEGIKMELVLGYPFHSVVNFEGGEFFDGLSFQKKQVSATCSGLITLQESLARIEATKKKYTDFGVKKLQSRSALCNTSFSLYSAIQSSVFGNLFTTTAGVSQGFLSRCFVVTPHLVEHEPVTHMPHHECEKQKHTFRDIVTRLYNAVDLTCVDGELSFKSLIISHANQELLDRFLKHFAPYREKDTAFAHGAGFISKAYQHVLELAGTLQAYRVAENNDVIATKQIDDDIFLLALQLTEYFHQHYLSSTKPYYKRISEYGVKGEEEKKLSHEHAKFLRRLEKILATPDFTHDRVINEFPIYKNMFHAYKDFRSDAKINAGTAALMHENVIEAVQIKKVDNGKEFLAHKTKPIKNSKPRPLYRFVKSIFEENEPYPSFFHPPAPPEPDPDDTPPDTEPSAPEPSTKPVAPSSKLPQQPAADSSSFQGKKPVIDTNQFTSTSSPRSALEKEQIRASIRIEDYVRAHYKIHAHNKINCPFHDDKTPSCQINSGSQNIYCYSCNQSWGVFDLIAKQNNLDIPRDFQQILEIAANFAGISSCSNVNARRISPAKASCDNSYNIDAAQKLYGRAKESREHKYLNERLGQLCPRTPAPRYTTYHDPVLKESYPAMVLPFCHGESVLGAHLTLLTPDLMQKAHVRPAKKMLGQTKGGYIPLFGETGNTSLLVAEGIETAIAAKIQLGFTGYVIAAGSSANLPDIEITSDIRSVIIASDNDEAGMTAAGKLYNRLRQAVVEVEIRNPSREYNDFCEELINKNTG